MLKSQYRRYGSLVYGIGTFRGLFNDRQLYVLATLCQAVRDTHDAMLAEGMDPDRALAVSTYLGFLVDKIADYDSFISWATSGEFQRSTFAGQAIAMVWDYFKVETDPFNGGDGIYDAHVRWVELAIRNCSPASSSVASVQRRDAQALSSDSSFDAVIVDPPYYDAIQYGDLSDFFYVWLTRSIGHLYPGLLPCAHAQAAGGDREPGRQEVPRAHLA